MREVNLTIPTLESEQNIEIDVRINGRKQTLCYRVELIDWEGEDSSTEHKIDVLKHKIKEFDKDWELIQIGAPNKDEIPLMFRKRK